MSAEPNKTTGTSGGKLVTTLHQKAVKPSRAYLPRSTQGSLLCIAQFAPLALARPAPTSSSPTPPRRSE